MRLLQLLLLAVCYSTRLLAVEPAPLPESTPWDLERLKIAPLANWIDRDSPVHSLVYGGETYHGEPTQVFAYFAAPWTIDSEAEKPVPGIVLVHGGGGRAFRDWAELWAKRGYAAIAMDLAGKGADGSALENGGPDQSHEEKFGTIDEPIENQWPYHAVANVILAHSLLRTMEDVDPNRVALTGISWGGYLTCIVAGLDDRFAMAMPVYGCGFLRDNSAWKATEFAKMTEAQSDKWHTLWDPSQYIGSATMPVAFLNGTNDFAYPIDSYAKTTALVQSPKEFSIQLRMRHGHIFDFPEFFAYVDERLKDGVPMPKVSAPEIHDNRLVTRVESETRIREAAIVYTTGPHAENPERAWVSEDLNIVDGALIGAPPPENATAWYVAVEDDRGLKASSKVMIP